MQQMQQMIMKLQQSAGLAISTARQAQAEAAKLGARTGYVEERLKEQTLAFTDLQKVLSKTVGARSGDPKIQYVENIPGRRVPFDLLVDIPIGASITSVQQQSVTVSQEGPFVAVCRIATFVSQYEFQYLNPDGGATSTFNGRSYGRYRPIHSAWDLNDGQPYNSVSQVVGFPGTGAPHVASPPTASPFRSMEGDFRIKFEDAGSSFPRSNLEVPSTFWTKEINSPFELGALDVFERGEVLTWKVLPLHPNNPAYGNLSAFGAPNPLYPFLDSQYDAVEGINDFNDPDATSDPITRLPNGVMTIGFHGYKIIQPAGAGPY